jgi:hypothetical protein
MCMSSKAPSAPPPPPPAPEPAKKASDAVRMARDETKKKSRSMAGDAASQLTGARGLMQPANTANTTLLGG